MIKKKANLDEESIPIINSDAAFQPPLAALSKPVSLFFIFFILKVSWSSLFKFVQNIEKDANLKTAEFWFRERKEIVDDATRGSCLTNRSIDKWGKFGK